MLPRPEPIIPRSRVRLSTTGAGLPPAHLRGLQVGSLVTLHAESPLLVVGEEPGKLAAVGHVAGGARQLLAGPGVQAGATDGVEMRLGGVVTAQAQGILRVC